MWRAFSSTAGSRYQALSVGILVTIHFFFFFVTRFWHVFPFFSVFGWTLLSRSIYWGVRPKCTNILFFVKLIVSFGGFTCRSLLQEWVILLCTMRVGTDTGSKHFVVEKIINLTLILEFAIALIVWSISNRNLIFHGF